MDKSKVQNNGKIKTHIVGFRGTMASMRTNITINDRGLKIIAFSMYTGIKYTKSIQLKENLSLRRINNQ